MIGQGAQSTVYRAVHKKTCKIVAIKVQKNLFQNDYEARRIINEIQIMKHLNRTTSSPNLLDLRVSRNLNEVYMVMDYF